MRTITSARFGHPVFLSTDTRDVRCHHHTWSAAHYPGTSVRLEGGCAVVTREDGSEIWVRDWLDLGVSSPEEKAPALRADPSPPPPPSPERPAPQRRTRRAKRTTKKPKKD